MDTEEDLQEPETSAGPAGLFRKTALAQLRFLPPAFDFALAIQPLRGVPRFQGAQRQAQRSRRAVRHGGLAVVVSGLTTIVFGVAPVLGVTRVAFAHSPPEGGAKAQGGRRGRRARSLLASFQIFVAVVSTLAAAFLLASLCRMQTETYGYDLDPVLTFRISLPNEGYENRAQVLDYHERAAERLEAIAWIENVAAIYPLPLDHTYRTVDLRIEGWQPVDAEERIFANHLVATAGFFETAGIRPLSGFADLGWGAFLAVAVGAPLMVVAACSGLARKAGEIEPVRLLTED